MKKDVKICGLTRFCDLDFPPEITHAGFILAERSPRRVSLKLLKELCLALPVNVRKVGVFAGNDLEFILEAVETARLDIVQLHGGENAGFAERIPVEVWKAVHLTSEEEVRRWCDYPAARFVADAAQGGSGVLSNWELAAKLATLRPVMVAGGITPDNAAEALRATGAAGVDCSSGVESAPGIKSGILIRQLAENIRNRKE
ncbi:MAG: Tryptophan biosynthesis protein TrpCF [Lentisphaerae bacterium ADurb.Bin242]|nr:MAG: Tryptophan biosynthesis protein TrpCF [Lentisphaerae bacterium ADurb.Bin242]